MKQTEWIPAPEFYDEWCETIKKNATEGNRYWQMYSLAIVAVKCQIPYDKLKADAEELCKVFNTVGTSPFTEEDMNDALQGFYDQDALFYYKHLVYALGGISIDISEEYEAFLKKQERLAKEQGEIYERKPLTKEQTLDLFARPKSRMALEGKPNWREGNGRKPLKSMVEGWLQEHPYGKRSDCQKALGLSAPTMQKWWKECGGYDSIMESATAFIKAYPDATKKQFREASGYSSGPIRAIWKEIITPVEE